MRNRTCSFATQHVRTHFSFAKSRKRSATVTFLDVVGAFDGVRRECLLAMGGGDEAIIKVFQKLGLDEAFSALDPELRQGFGGFVRAQIRDRGIPALLVSHDAADAAFADAGLIQI